MLQYIKQLLLLTVGTVALSVSNCFCKMQNVHYKRDTCMKELNQALLTIGVSIGVRVSF